MSAADYEAGVRAMREACAKVAEQFVHRGDGFVSTGSIWQTETAQKVAAAIRALPLPEAEATTGRHWDSCAFVHATGPCDCGFDAVATDIPNPTSPTADAERAVVEAALAQDEANQRVSGATHKPPTEVYEAIREQSAAAASLRVAVRNLAALRAAAPEEPPELGEASMPRVGGKPFRCDCGANVFTRRGMKFTCNGCGTVYEGTPKAAR